MSWMKYIITFVATVLAFVLCSLWELPVDNNAIWLGLCVLGNAFIAYREK